MWKILNFAHKGNKFFISNVSKKKFQYSFETGVSNKPHPKRNLINGADKIYVSDHLIMIADHGNM